MGQNPKIRAAALMDSHMGTHDGSTTADIMLQLHHAQLALSQAEREALIRASEPTDAQRGMDTELAVVEALSDEDIMMKFIDVYDSTPLEYQEHMARTRVPGERERLRQKIHEKFFGGDAAALHEKQVCMHVYVYLYASRTSAAARGSRGGHSQSAGAMHQPRVSPCREA